MKKRTLNQTWTLCLRMYGSIAKVWGIDRRRTINSMKKQWLKQNGFNKVKIIANCFFCDFNMTKNGCPECPGKLVDRSFSCCKESHNYQEKPVEFYAELLRLNQIRKNRKTK